MDKKLEGLQKNIAYHFKDINLLKKALTHSSYANEKKLESNQRLEFLGDAVLELASSEYIFNNHDAKEGKLTDLRKCCVCREALAYCGKEVELERYLLLGNGEESTGGRENIKNIEDAFEALIGAIYLDGGFSSAKEVVVNSIVKRILDNPDTMQLFYDSKTIFQEEIQTFTKEPISYNLISTKGPDHKKIFKVELRVGDELYAIAEGGNKKAAEKKAAFLALKKLERI